MERETPWQPRLISDGIANFFGWIFGISGKCLETISLAPTHERALGLTRLLVLAEFVKSKQNETWLTVPDRLRYLPIVQCFNEEISLDGQTLSFNGFHNESALREFFGLSEKEVYTIFGNLEAYHSREEFSQSVTNFVESHFDFYWRKHVEGLLCSSK